MISTEKVLEFDIIKEQLQEFAYTDKAKMMIKDLQPYMDEVELHGRLRETSEAKLLLEKEGNPPFTSLSGIDELLQVANIGGCLTAEELETVAYALTAISRLKDYLKRCKKYEIGLPYYEENLDSLDEIKEELHVKIRGGKVDDYATKLLKSLREGIDLTEIKMREKADMVLKSNKEYMSDNFTTMRNGHICIPVKKEYRSKISGSVIDKSSTGSTLFIEPTTVSKYYDDLQNLRIDEENETRRILYTLTAMLADVSDIMKNNSHTIEKLDFIFAKGKLSLSYDGVEPHINLERRIVIKSGRHPLMDKKINVPLQFRIGDGINGIVITGPNTGGKTVAIKTVALNCLLAQCGLHVACEEADICMNNAILCDIGDGQNISENLSTFSSHITNVLEILKRANKDSLVIMDEVGSGTDPTEGMGIAIAILEELRKSGALYLVTTHYPEVKNYADKYDGILNARMTFDKESLKPLYQLVIGEAGESCAFYIAQKLGMPDSMLKIAVKEAYGDKIPEDLVFEGEKDVLKKETSQSIRKKKKFTNDQTEAKKFNLGDSVMVYPDKKLGIVCQTANEKGALRVQLPGKKIWINHKRVKLQVPASQLYPEDYDFSIIFDTVENRKLRHQMDRKYTEGEIIMDNN